MATTTFNVYKTTQGRYTLEDYKASYPSHDWDKYLKETNQLERLERLNAMSSRKRSPRLNRLYKSADFIEWGNANMVNVTSELYGVVTCNYDGRLSEARIKYAVLEAIRYGEKEAHYEPLSNARKPAHEHLVYIFTFDLKMA